MNIYTVEGRYGPTGVAYFSKPLAHMEMMSRAKVMFEETYKPAGGWRIVVEGDKISIQSDNNVTAMNWWLAEYEVKDKPPMVDRPANL